MLSRFFWPWVHKKVVNSCASCPECQQVVPKGHLWAPLVLLSLMRTPFEQVEMDIVGPLEKRPNGSRVVDSAIHYPVAVPFCLITAKAIARKLILLFAQVLHSYGSNFASCLMQKIWQLLKIRPLQISVSHPRPVAWWKGLIRFLNK